MGSTDLRGSTADSSDVRAGLIQELDYRFLPQTIRRQRTRRLRHGIAWLIGIQLVLGIKRAVDLAAAVLALTFCCPFLVALLAIAKSRGGGFVHSRRVGRGGVVFSLYQISFRSSLDRTVLVYLPVLLNLFKGDLSLIGPRAVTLDRRPKEQSAWLRYQVRPGLICLWWIRKRANIAYVTESQVDAEYVGTQSLKGDLGILLRAIPAAFYGEGVANLPDIVRLAGIPINNLTMEEAIDQIIAPTRTWLQICFVNADCVNIAVRRKDYAQLLNATGLVLADGIGIKLAGKVLNTHIRQNVNGTDMFPALCDRLTKSDRRLFLLGGRPDVVEGLASWISKTYPGLNLCGYQHGFFDADEEPAVIEKIRESRADILLVALGAPRQDLWIQQHQAKTGARVAMGVGGLFDFYSGRIPRAPLWLREIGGEWFFRFIQEPRRMWRRYFVGNVVFLFRVFRYRAQASKSDSPQSGDV